MIAGNLLRGRFLVKVLFQIIKNVFETKEILRRDFTKRFVRFQHGARLFLLLLGARAGFARDHATLRRGGTITLNVEDLIKTEAGEQRATARAAMDNMKVSLPEFLQ